jgi:phage terminase Nu1 subunit (DNA packaging protein)
VVASIKQGQDSLNRLKVEYNELEHLARQIDQALATIPFTDRQEAKRLIEEY